MPPIHTGMSVQVGLPSSVDTCLRQWLKVASGDRVYLFQHTSGMSYSYTVFKCRSCGDNWHVGNENFEGTGIPQTLKDWVNKHRHVCGKWVPKFGLENTGSCRTCGWPYAAHDELKETVTAQVISKTGSKKLPEFTGRKFRDVE